MGQTPSSSRRVNALSCEETSDEIWAEIVHVSDRDVLVKDMGGKRQQKVKLKDGRKKRQMDNVHLLDKKRLEGIHMYKLQGTTGSSKALKDNDKAGLSTGITNHGFLPPETHVEDSYTKSVEQNFTAQPNVLPNKFGMIREKPEKDERRGEGSKRENNAKIKTRDDVLDPDIKYQRFLYIDEKAVDQDLTVSPSRDHPKQGCQEEEIELSTVGDRATGRKNRVMQSVAAIFEKESRKIFPQK